MQPAWNFCEFVFLNCHLKCLLYFLHVLSFNRLQLSWQQITCFMTQPAVETQNHRITLDIVVWPLLHHPVCWPVLNLRFSVTFPWNTVLSKTTLLYFTSDLMEFCNGDTCYILLCEFHFGLHWISEMTALGETQTEQSIFWTVIHRVVQKIGTSYDL